VDFDFESGTNGAEDVEVAEQNTAMRARTGFKAMRGYSW
jgi:hypothetical protein